MSRTVNRDLEFYNFVERTVTSRHILLHTSDLFCFIWNKELEAIKMAEYHEVTDREQEGGVNFCKVCLHDILNYHWKCLNCHCLVCTDCHMYALLGNPENLPPCQQNGEYFEHDISQFEIQKMSKDNIQLLARKVHDLQNLLQLPQSCKCLFNQLDVNTQVTQCQFPEKAMKIVEAALKKQSGQEKELAGESFAKKASEISDFISLLTRFEMKQLSMRLYQKPEHSWLYTNNLLFVSHAKYWYNNTILQFREAWKLGKPVIVAGAHEFLNLDLWEPKLFCQKFGEKCHTIINCLNGEVMNHKMSIFWQGFESYQKCLLGYKQEPLVLKLKEWPEKHEFATLLPQQYADFLEALPMPQYTLPTGRYNLLRTLPKICETPALGTEMINAYGLPTRATEGTCALTVNLIDSVNVLVHVYDNIDAACNDHIYLEELGQQAPLAASHYVARSKATPDKNLKPGVLWNIYLAEDADKIRDFLKSLLLEKGVVLPPEVDALFEAKFYLPKMLRTRLRKTLGVRSIDIIQCLGDAIFLPAGSLHQVKNLRNCINVSQNFMSPESCRLMYNMHRERRGTSLPIQNILFYVMQDLSNHFEDLQQCK